MQWLESEEKSEKFVLLKSCFYWMVSYICNTLVLTLLLRSFCSGFKV